eukprot:1143503-Pelagomonas_calceolata.AAC.1
MSTESLELSSEVSTRAKSCTKLQELVVTGKYTIVFPQEALSSHKESSLTFSAGSIHRARHPDCFYLYHYSEGLDPAIWGVLSQETFLSLTGSTPPKPCYALLFCGSKRHIHAINKLGRSA